MAIPDYQSLMLPVLKSCANGEEHQVRSITEKVTAALQLSSEDSQKLLPSGQQTIVENRIAWARAYLKKAGLIESTKRAHVRLTTEGKNVLASSPTRIDNAFLMKFKSFSQWREDSKTPSARLDPVTSSGANADWQTPAEVLEQAYGALRAEITADLLTQVKSGSPAFFESLVVDLLVRMGYGGSRTEAGRAIGRSGDGGVDGEIHEDRLGLDKIYIQAKRWETKAVSGPDIRDFIGALSLKGARKGVFITTSCFTKDAADNAAQLKDRTIVLIDGRRLVELMLEFGLGITVKQTYTLHKVDLDYFDEEA